MADLVTQNWILFVAALIIGLLVAWWIFAANRRTKVTLDRDPAEGTGPARRNQALIDAPPAAVRDPVPPAATPPPAPVAEALVAAPAPIEKPVVIAEPVAVEVVAPAPVVSPAPAASPATEQASGADDLTRIKGLGPKIAELLRDMNITTYAEIAAWDDAAIDRVDAGLGRFQGRVRRDNWVEQARHLAAGDIAGYEGSFGKL